MAGFAVELKGLKEVLKELDTDIIQDELNDELYKFGADVVRDAQQNLATHGNIDEGRLTGSIAFAPLPNGVEIVANCVYAAYVEFGTRKYAAAEVAKLPAEWKVYAATFKGKSGGGDYFDFLNAILDWVMRKGIASRYSVKTQRKVGIDLVKPSKGKQGTEDRERLEQTAYMIARNIMRNGSKAHPYLFPAFEKNRPLLLERLRKYLKDKG